MGAFGATAAQGSLQGIIGYSGKQGETCNGCHDNEGMAPVVDIEGPLQFAADTTAQFRFIVRSQGQRQLFAGFNVAASDGTLRIDGKGTRVEANELTHTAPQSNDEAGVSAWTFGWCVPIGGDFRLFGSGNSVNGNGTRSGDAASEAVLEVEVTPPSGDVNCDGRRTVADVTAIFNASSVGSPGACESTDGGTADGMPEIAATLELLFAPTCVPAA